MEKRRGVTQQTPRPEHRFARSTLPYKLRLGEGEAPGLHPPGGAGRVEKRAFSEFFGEGTMRISLDERSANAGQFQPFARCA